MHRRVGGSKVASAVGLGLTAGLFAFGIVLVGTMVVLEQVLGGVGGEETKPAANPERAAA